LSCRTSNNRIGQKEKTNSKTEKPTIARRKQQHIEKKKNIHQQDHQSTQQASRTPNISRDQKPPSPRLVAWVKAHPRSSRKADVEESQDDRLRTQIYSSLLRSNGEFEYLQIIGEKNQRTKKAYNLHEQRWEGWRRRDKLRQEYKRFYKKKQQQENKNEKQKSHENLS
jgi:hypothetical protein